MSTYIYIYMYAYTYTFRSIWIIVTIYSIETLRMYICNTKVCLNVCLFEIAEVQTKIFHFTECP